MKLGHYITEAAKLYKKHCKANPDTRFRHFSFIVDSHYNGNILAVGFNRPATSNLKRYGYKLDYLHSELDAYFNLDAEGRKKMGAIINVRLGADLTPRDACPCRICSSFLRAVGISKVYATPSFEIEL